MWSIFEAEQSVPGREINFCFKCGCNPGPLIHSPTLEPLGHQQHIVLCPDYFLPSGCKKWRLGMRLQTTHPAFTCCTHVSAGYIHSHEETSSCSSSLLMCLPLNVWKKCTMNNVFRCLQILVASFGLGSRSQIISPRNSWTYYTISNCECHQTLSCFSCESLRPARLLLAHHLPSTSLASPTH